MFCRNCGSQLPDGSAFCESCGVDVKAPPQQRVQQVYPSPHHPQAKSRMAAGLLGVFLGSLGVHRFYLGHIGLGVVQILFTCITFGIGGLWGFIEGIVILAGGIKTDANGIPLRD